MKKLVRTLVVLSALGLMANACSSRDAKSSKPKNTSAGQEQTPVAPETDTRADPDCTAEDVGFCLCVEGGFEFDGDVWDFYCCVAEGEAGLHFCGSDSDGCSAETFDCL